MCGSVILWSACVKVLLGYWTGQRNNNHKTSESGTLAYSCSRGAAGAVTQLLVSWRRERGIKVRFSLRICGPFNESRSRIWWPTLEADGTCWVLKTWECVLGQVLENLEEGNNAIESEKIFVEFHPSCRCRQIHEVFISGRKGDIGSI
jgi:hypothetical protein